MMKLDCKVSMFFRLILLGLLFQQCAFAKEDKGKAGVEEISLNGTWDFLIDDKNEGKLAKWYENEIFDKQAAQKQIKVPSCWEEYEQDYEGVAFYRKEFNVPLSWEGKNIEIHFGAVNYIAEVWMNNEVVGYHKGGFTPFSFKLNKTVKAGEKNVLTMRVVSPVLYKDKVIDGIGPHQTPMWRGALTGGVWQDVSLTAKGDFLVKDVYIKTDIRKKTANFEFELENTKVTNETTSVHLNILDKNNKLVASQSEELALTPGKNKYTWDLAIKNATLWDIDNPYLYKAVLSVGQNKVASDTWNTKFGLREFTIKDKKYQLNGKPFYLKGGFFEGLYPTKLAYPDSREMAIREIQLAKDAGFNMIRPWRKPPPPMWLDLCDSMGVLTVGSLAIECMHRPIASPQLPEMVEIEVRESIMRDRNRTCVIQWELFNELWQPVLIEMLHPMSLLARELDPTRLILDESGGFANGANIYLPNQKTPEKFNDIHSYPGWRFNDGQYKGFTMIGATAEARKAVGLRKKGGPGRHVQEGLMVFVSEIGYGSLPDLEANNKTFKEKGNPLAPMYRDHARLEMEYKAALKSSGFDEVFPTLKSFIDAQHEMHGNLNKRMLEASRSNPLTSGYCIHALTDGDWIVGGGIIDLWRNPKGAVYEKTKEANQPQTVSVRVHNRNLYEGKTSPLSIIGINEYEGFNGKLVVKITDEKGKEVFSKELKANFENGLSDLYNEKLETNGLSGIYTVTATLFNKDGEQITQNTDDFAVFDKEDLAVPTHEVSILEANQQLAKFFKTKGIAYSTFSANQATSKLLVVGKLGKEDDKAFRAKVEQAKAFAAKGGKVYFLEVASEKVDDSHARILPKSQSADAFPYGGLHVMTNGLWQSTGHITKKHPIFNGLPSGEYMQDLYHNVGTTKSLLRPDGNIITGVISTDRYPNQDNMKRNYIGVGEVWVASDIVEFKTGKGLEVYSTLEIPRQLGKDPVAEKLLYNIINHYSESTVN